MRSLVPVVALLGLVAAIPHPQLADLDAVDAADDPVFVTPPVDVALNLPAALTTTSVAPITTEDPGASKLKRSYQIERRDGNCAPQPSGSGPVITPDTASAFLAAPTFSALASQAPTPYGYVLAFSNLQASLSASNYMGLHTLTTYDTTLCQSKCDQASGCVAFNLYAERDPTLSPNAANCPNPPSLTNYKCTLWGAPVSASEALNTGQYRDNFQVVIAASNAYNKDSPPETIPGYTGPTELGGAINAPLDSNGYNTYMGFQYFPFSQSQNSDPITCAQACTSQTTYNQQHPNADCSYQPCVFFNAYVLSENGVPQGLYCSLYNETWTPKYATNYGQYRGSDHYTVSDSYSYSVTNPVAQPASAC